MRKEEMRHAAQHVCLCARVQMKLMDDAPGRG